MTDISNDDKDLPKGFISQIVQTFIISPLSMMLIILSLFLGVFALIVTPEEEDPQIVVPIADVLIDAPGISTGEVEKLISTPLEQLLWQIDGVEYVYSTSMEGRSIVTVRFYVGQDRERSLIKLYNKINSNLDLVPPIVQKWIVKPIEIDDVPIVNISLHSKKFNAEELRRIGLETLSHLEEVENISRTEIVGGSPELLRVEPDNDALKARNISLKDLAKAIQAADSQLNAGSFKSNDKSYFVYTGPSLRNRKEVEKIIVGVFDNRPVYLADVAKIFTTTDYPTNFTRILYKGQGKVNIEPSVTLALAKKRGSNAVTLSNDIKQKLTDLQKNVLPADVSATITRDFGLTAKEKVDDLVNSLFLAIATIVIILMIALGWREGLIVALAVPISFSLTLFTNYILGYTINRVTLFALILTLGLIVDDPIINVDNIQRYILKGKYSPFRATVLAVQEVLPPVIVSSLTIIVSFIPMFFITGMMGPYMAPMSINVPLAITYSTLAALTIVPWASFLLLKGKTGLMKTQKDASFSLFHEKYRNFLTLFLEKKTYRRGLLAMIIVMLIISALLIVLRLVPLKMLPFDNKNELQVVINMPEGTTLETTDAVVRDFENLLITNQEIVNLNSFVGTHSPIDFNGMVRHHYLREKQNYADIRINLLDKADRTLQTHEIALKLRRSIEDLAKKHGANVFIIETTPGPPVLSTFVAEIYGKPNASYEQLIDGGKFVETLLRQLPGAVDIDMSSETPHDKLIYLLDKEKATLHGINALDVAQTVKLAVNGERVASLHKNNERESYYVQVKPSEQERSGADKLDEVHVLNKKGSSVSLGEMGTFVSTPQDQPIYHKNLKRVVYVYSEVAGKAPVDIVFGLENKLKSFPDTSGLLFELTGEGEWFITIKAFRDLGIAFGVALLFIYVILATQTGSFLMPSVMMTAIPLSLIGIMPGFFLLNLVAGNSIDGYANPIFFTATAMIGVIALGGIVIRNSSVLISFIEESLLTGVPMREAILDSGVVRMRPILLTALVTAVGVWPITLDPIFSGLGWALIFGLFVSTLFSLIVVPVIYWILYRPSQRHS